MGNLQIPALINVNLEIQSGEMVTIMGKSGSGKSTLLRCIGLLDTPTSGNIHLDGENTTIAKEKYLSFLRLTKIGYVFQEYALLPELTAIENVFLPSIMKDGHKVENYNKALVLLDQVGLKHKEKHLPKELSGGEQQRVAIARSLVNNPKVILADEPCANLDTISSKLVMQTFQKLNQDLGITVIFVSHDPEDKAYSNRQIFMKDGNLVNLKSATLGSKIQVKFLNGVEKEFEVVGIIYSYHWMADYNYFFNIAQFQEIFGKSYENAITTFNIKLKNPANLNTTFADLQEKNLGKLYKYTDLPSATTSLNSSFGIVIRLLQSISLLVGGITIFIISYVDLLNKRKQIGIQRAIGIKKSSIFIEYLVRSLVYTIFSLTLGYLIFLYLVIPLEKAYPLDFSFGPTYIYLDYPYIVESFLAILLISIISVVIPIYNITKLKILDSIWG